MKVKGGIDKRMSDLQLKDDTSQTNSSSAAQQKENTTTTQSGSETNHPWFQHGAFGPPPPFYMGMFPHSHQYMFEGHARHIDDGENSDSETTGRGPCDPSTNDELQTDDEDYMGFQSQHGHLHGPPPFMGPRGIGPYGMGPHGIGPHGMGPHGTGLQGMGPHGIGPHGMEPHGMGPPHMHPWMSMMPPPSFAMAMQRKMAKKWMKKMKKHSKQELKRNKGNKHMQPHDHVNHAADSDASKELNEGNIDPSCEPASADSHKMTANNSDDNASSSGDDATWDFPPFMPPWMMIGQPWRMRKQGCKHGRHLHKHLQRKQFKHQHCAGGFHWGKHRCHKRWNGSKAQESSKEPETAETNNEEKQRARTTAISVDGDDME